ncbi:hypothetical protein AvCA_02680 [Azotobacter vinelandii CA]|uniref:Uncharacterized protein n=2 Tax=Azotobacter vinelandii TaxID=354 RepID=C1DI32_AZOVD|nr:hypothetical protein Avin_02680 [Azotobacter vinelandii DJ]AGK15652.1 hypothetical protein AvCA_02680 [Azotobacter vinelandii CA]AGK19192.1 hypothetical protein AvCA6_02680 [Azotobacter vinelandii CA6]
MLDGAGRPIGEEARGWMVRGIAGRNRSLIEQKGDYRLVDWTGAVVAFGGALPPTTTTREIP